LRGSFQVHESAGLSTSHPRMGQDPSPPLVLNRDERQNVISWQRRPCGARRKSWRANTPVKPSSCISTETSPTHSRARVSPNRHAGKISSSNLLALIRRTDPPRPRSTQAAQTSRYPRGTKSSSRADTMHACLRPCHLAGIFRAAGTTKRCPARSCDPHAQSAGEKPVRRCSFVQTGDGGPSKLPPLQRCFTEWEFRRLCAPTAANRDKENWLVLYAPPARSFRPTVRGESLRHLSDVYLKFHRH